MRFVILIVIIAIAAIAGFAVLHIAGNAAPPTQQPVVQTTAPRESVSTVDVIVAKQPIPLGAVLDDAMLDKQPWPEHLALEGFIIAGGKNSALKGKVTRGSFQAREPLTMNKLADPNDAGFLAAELPEGMRAITLPADAISGVAGYVFPGDRVDVVLTHNIPNDLAVQQQGATGLSSRPSVSEVLVPNVRVMAVNVRVAGNQDPNANPMPNNFSLEVTDLDAQRIRLSEKLGTISFALRSIKDKTVQTMAPPSESGQLSRLRVVGKLPDAKLDEPKVDEVRIIRGAGPSNEPKTPAAADAPKPVFSTQLADPNAVLGANQPGSTQPIANQPSPPNANPPVPLPPGVTRVLQ